MRKRDENISTLILLILVSSATLSAQSREVWVSGGVSNFRFPYPHTNRDLGSTDIAANRTDIQLGDGWRIGFRLALNSAGFLWA
jgi:hypothetical protein